MPVDVSSDEMEVSSKGSNDSGDSSPGHPSTLRNQAAPPHKQGAPECQALLTDTSAGTSSRPPVPTSASETTERGGESPPSEEHVGESPPSEEHVGESPPSEEHVGESPPSEEHVGERPPSEEHVGERPPNEEHVGERPPNEEHAGGQHPDAERLNTVDRRVSKYVSNAQTILLTVFKEMLESQDAEGLYKLFLQELESVRRPQDLGLLVERLEFCVDQMETSRLVKCSCMTPKNTLEMDINLRFRKLFRIVVAAITLTLSVEPSLIFENIISEYRLSQSFYRKYFQFWQGRDISQLDEVSRNRVECLKKITERLLLQTRNAYRELLIHIGENAENVSIYEDGVVGEDLRCLRRQIAYFREDFSDETDSREDVSDETDPREDVPEANDPREDVSGGN